jgi:hypothetical protein
VADPSAVGAGTYFIKVSTAAGCSDIESVTVTVNPTPSLAITAPSAVCAPNTVDLTAAAVIFGSSLEGGSLSYWTNADATVAVADPSAVGAGTYFIKVSTAAGCSDIESVTVTVNPLPTVGVNSPNVCVGSSAVLTATTNTETGFVWAPGGQTTASITVNPISNATYVVTVTNGVTGCSNSATSTVTVSDNPTITVPNHIISDCGPFVSLLDKYSIPNGTMMSITLNGNNVTNPSKVGAGTYVVTAQNAAGCTTTATIKVNINCYTFTLSQGFYGSTNGTKCLNITGVSTRYNAVQLIGAILKDNPMTLGRLPGTLGGRSFYVTSNDAIALNRIMPGGSGGSALPAINLTSANWNTTNILTKQGKINNVLLSQTITMWLNMNMRENNVGNWLLADIGSVPSAVISAAGGVASAKVSDLVRLASRALGGESLTGGVTFSSLVSALDLVIKRFDNAAGEAGACSNVFGDQNQTVLLISSARMVGAGDEMPSASANKVEVENAQLVVMAFPNPYIDQVTFNVTVKNAGKGSLVIYNMLGQKVTNLFEGNMQANSTQTIRYNVPFAQRKNLVYVFRQNDTISTGKLVSGK